MTWSGLYDGVALEYDRLYSSRKDVAENHIIRERLLQLGIERRDVLDLGCGTGLLIDLLPELNFQHYVGLDISAGMIARAEQKFPAYSFLQIGMEDFSYAGSFSAAVSLFAFNYCSEPLLTIYRLLDSLAPGSPVLFVVYGPRYPKSPEYLHRGCSLTAPGMTAMQLRVMFRAYHDVRVQGLSYRRLPPRLPQIAHTTWAHLEHQTVGRIAPNDALFLMLTARTPR